MHIDYDNLNAINWVELKEKARKELDNLPVVNSALYPEIIEKGKYFNFRCWTDVHPGVVVEVVSSKKIIVECLEYTADRSAEDWGMGSQNWIVYHDPARATHKTFTKRKDGSWRELGAKGNHGYIGHFSDEPRCYYDWSF